MVIPKQACDIRVAFLPPMSGLAASERRVDEGAINVLLGEGRTAEVLRNLCYQIWQMDHSGNGTWGELSEKMKRLFGVTLDEPQYVKERGEILMTYRTHEGVRLDLSTAGRGLHQTLLLFAHLLVNPKSVLLLDEPDAHLEILRQREIYGLLAETARQQESQIIIASHSEVILNEAADRDVVVAFVGTPHRIDDRGSQLLKALKSIGFDQYYQAEETGWVLYLEGATDLAVLQAFAKTLESPAAGHLERPFVRYIQNQLSQGRDHFRGLREGKNDLVGFLLCDRLPEGQQVQESQDLHEHAWAKREIENYLCQPKTLIAYAEGNITELQIGPLLEPGLKHRSRDVMQACIVDFAPPAAYRDGSDPWWANVKASDEFLDRVFRKYYKEMGVGRLIDKNNYHLLARFVPGSMIDQEVKDVLEWITKTALRAKPTGKQGGNQS
jgi:hypothetical protein